jgi:DNA adenine methylase
LNTLAAPSEAPIRPQAPAAPFLKWAGSKRWLLSSIKALGPSSFDAYYEPFLGSGSTYFAVAAGHQAYLSDKIPGLIECYEQVRDQPQTVYDRYNSWPTDEETYYRIRATTFTSAPTRAARFIYLNKLCFNGLYRENQSGEFNVPYGRPKTSNIVSLPALLDASKTLGDRATFGTGDFENALQGCQRNDYVYLDPPYVNIDKSRAFAGYNASAFTWRDQQRLCDTFYQLQSAGVHVVMSNANHEAISDLYKRNTQVVIPRYSSMSSSAKTRGLSSELLILSDTISDSL